MKEKVVFENPRYLPIVLTQKDWRKFIWYSSYWMRTLITILLDTYHRNTLSNYLKLFSQRYILCIVNGVYFQRLSLNTSSEAAFEVKVVIPSIKSLAAAAEQRGHLKLNISLIYCGYLLFNMLLFTLQGLNQSELDSWRAFCSMQWSNCWLPNQWLISNYWIIQ